MLRDKFKKQIQLIVFNLIYFECQITISILTNNHMIHFYYLKSQINFAKKSY
jgi:hypothetical protein